MARGMARSGAAGQGKARNGKAGRGRPTKRKTAKKKKAKRCVSPRSGNELEPGAHPKNTGGKKGRSGRKPNAFKHLCREILEDEGVQAALRLAALNPSAAGYSGVMKMLASYAEGLPTQTVKHEGGVTHSADDRVQRILELLANAKSRQG